ncbi:hypothetical protein COHA_008451 [Chlorella ohadii]|uniref:Uncharacterized protein n=1 Tax=Chlorella ohadii TaxID=2649997 RepID=A0AAD5DJX7_9CHLO|nr:hypothetical protein COHA_008451 [Chlorella ohadii]
MLIFNEAGLPPSSLFADDYCPGGHCCSNKCQKNPCNDHGCGNGNCNCPVQTSCENQEGCCWDKMKGECKIGNDCNDRCTKDDDCGYGNHCCNKKCQKDECSCTKDDDCGYGNHCCNKKTAMPMAPAAATAMSARAPLPAARSEVLKASQLSPPTLGKQGALYKNNCWNCCGNLILKHRRCEAAQNHMYDVLMG